MIEPLNNSVHFAALRFYLDRFCIAEDQSITGEKSPCITHGMEPSATPQRCGRRKEKKVDGERCDISFRRTLRRYEPHALVLEAGKKDVCECMECYKLLKL